MPMTSNELRAKATPCEENYLKVLFELSGGGEVHSSEVAATLGVSRASVSNMMERLKNEGYVAKEKYGTITLTEQGIGKAVEIKKRYCLLRSFFIKVLGVSATTAARDACLLEHIVSTESIEQIATHLFAHEQDQKQKYQKRKKVK